MLEHSFQPPQLQVCLAMKPAGFAKAEINLSPSCSKLT